ncbi:MAG: formylglycine-generating enzyme family protein [Polynucleobacter sp.]|nr:formylglycine-generating enzyme family protein [Polynucleobacter sp.]
MPLISCIKKSIKSLFYTVSLLISFGVFAQNPQSQIANVKIGNILWDLTETTIGEVKRYAQVTGFRSAAEMQGGGLSYEMGFVKKPGWSWRTPYGVTANDQEPAVHLNAQEAQTICRFYGKRLPTDSEWVMAAYLEQRSQPKDGFTSGRRYQYPNGDTARGSHCLAGCAEHQGVAPKGALNRGTGHVLVGTTKPGVNGLFDMGGNVWEWTASSNSGQSITRGASWWYGPEQQLESNVATKPNDTTVVYIGFRCVKDVPSAALSEKP